MHEFILVKPKQTCTSWQNVVIFNHQSRVVFWNDVVKTQSLKYVRITGALSEPQKTSFWGCTPFSSFTATAAVTHCVCRCNIWLAICLQANYTNSKSHLKSQMCTLQVFQTHKNPLQRKSTFSYISSSLQNSMWLTWQKLWWQKSTTHYILNYDNLITFDKQKKNSPQNEKQYHLFTDNMKVLQGKMCDSVVTQRNAGIQTEFTSISATDFTAVASEKCASILNNLKICVYVTVWWQSTLKLAVRRNAKWQLTFRLNELVSITSKLLIISSPLSTTQLQKQPLHTSHRITA